MAKVKFSDLLSKLFGDKLDQEVDLEESSATDTNEEEVADDKSDEQEEKETSENEEEPEVEDNKEEQDGSDNVEEPEVGDIDPTTDKPDNVYVDIFYDGWLSSDNLSVSVDYTKITNDEVAKAIKFLTYMYSFSLEVADCVKELDLNISEEAFIKMLREHINPYDSVENDSKCNKDVIVSAINALREKEPKLFNTKSDPLEEGIDPVDKSKGLIPNSFTEAFDLMS